MSSQPPGEQPKPSVSWPHEHKSYMKDHEIMQEVLENIDKFTRAFMDTKMLMAHFNINRERAYFIKAKMQWSYKDQGKTLY